MSIDGVAMVAAFLAGLVVGGTLAPILVWNALVRRHSAELERLTLFWQTGLTRNLPAVESTGRTADGESMDPSVGVTPETIEQGVTHMQKLYAESGIQLSESDARDQVMRMMNGQPPVPW